MSSRLTRRILGAALSLSLLTSCNQVFDKTPATVATSVPNLGFQQQCLANVLPVMEGFLKGSAAAAEVSGVWHCFSSAITVFQQRVRGSTPGQYTPREVAEFFENYLFKNLKLTDDLLLQVMYLKTLFVGGSTSVLTKPELAKLVKFSDTMNHVSIELLPYMKIFSLSWTPDPNGNLQDNLRYFENGNLAVQKAAKELSILVTNNDQNYTLSNISSLMHALEPLYGANWTWLARFDQSIPLVQNLKAALAGGDGKVIAANEWGQFSLLISRGYVQYLRYYYFIQNSDQSDPQLNYLSESITDLLSYLGDMIQGKSTGVLTAQDLQSIFDAAGALFPDLVFDPDFVPQIMKLKVVVFGGRIDNWTPADFQRVLAKVSTIRSLMEDVYLYFKVYTMDWHPSDLSEADGQRYFQSASDTLLQSSQLMAAVLESDYDLDDLNKIVKDLVDMFAKLSVNNPNLTWPSKIQKFLPAVTTAKQMVLNEKTTIVHKADWQNVLGWVARLGSKAYYYYYFVNPRTTNSGPGLESFDKLINTTETLLSQMIDFRASRATSPDRGAANGEITNAELANFVLALNQGGVFSGNFNLASITAVVQAVTQKFLQDPAARLGGVLPNGISKTTLVYAVNEYSTWSDTQHMLAKLYRDNGNQSIMAPDLVKNLAASPLTGAGELKTVISLNPSFVLDGLNRLIIAKKDHPYDLHSTSNLNFAKTLARLIIRAYVGDLARMNNPSTGVTSAEVNKLYADVKALIVQMGIVQSTNMTFMSNRFLEANLFTPSGDGNSYLNLSEASQLITMILSGLQLNSIVSSGLGDQCEVGSGNTGGPNDVLDVKCVIAFYNNNFPQIFDSMPDLNAYMISLSPANFYTAALAFLKIAGWVPTHDTTALRSDIALLPHVFQYLESVLQRFDQKKVGALDDNDTAIAFPVYEAVLQRFSKTNIKIINQAAFDYLLKEGKIPCGFNDLVGDILKLLLGQKMNVHADRGSLSNVFGAIADSIAGTSTSCPKNSATGLADEPPGFQRQFNMSVQTHDFSNVPNVEYPADHLYLLIPQGLEH